MLLLNWEESILSELLNANDLVLMSLTIEDLSNKFIKWKMVFGYKGLKVILGKTEVIVSSGITKDGLPNVKFFHLGSTG